MSGHGGMPQRCLSRVQRASACRQIAAVRNGSGAVPAALEPLAPHQEMRVAIDIAAWQATTWCCQSQAARRQRRQATWTSSQSEMLLQPSTELPCAVCHKVHFNQSTALAHVRQASCILLANALRALTLPRLAQSESLRCSPVQPIHPCI